MHKFPVDAPVDRVLQAFARLGSIEVHRGNHIAMIRQNNDGIKTPLTMPNHRHIKGSTLRSISSQANIHREDFLASYYQ